MSLSETVTEAAATVLNVDDNDDARESLSMFLRVCGFTVLEASTGEQALRLLRDRPDIVILDVILPDHSGFEICGAIKRDRATAATPVLMLSGEAVSPSDHVTGLEGGADGYLTKPADPALVLAHVRALLRVRQAEQISRKAARVLENTSDCFVTLDLDWRYTYLNPQAERVLRKRKQDVLGQVLWDVFPEAPGSVRRQSYEQSMAERVPVELEEYFPGLDAWLEVRGFPSDEGMTFVFRDVTERRRLEEQYRQAQKMEAFGQLAGGVAHDFNNLLTIINGYGDIALDCLPADHPATNLVSEMRKAGDRAANLTKQLLAFTRKAVIAPRVLDLNTVVREVVRMMRTIIGEDVQLVTHLDADLGPVKADQGQVEQVILNLAVNARDAMPRGGRITIETRNHVVEHALTLGSRTVPPGDYIVLGVRDTGTGMAPEVEARVFEPFFTTKGPGKGTGLGLASVLGIVQQSGGHIAVETKPDAGSAFQVFLPRVALPSSQVKAASAFLSLATGTETILFVEDEDALRVLGRSVLKHAGYTVLEAGRGEDALKLAERHARAIDMVVTDVVLPGMNGRQLVDAVQHRYPAIKVLYLSGHADDAVLRHGVEETRMHFLAKPFTPNGLAKKVRDVLDA